MILKNYWQYQKDVALHYPDESNKTTTLNALNMSGSQATAYLQAYNNSESARRAESNFSARKNLKLRVGTGTDEPEIDDYALGTDIMSDISSVSQNYQMSPGNDGFTTRFTLSGTNNSGSEMTITEYGIFKEVFTTWNIDSTSDVIFAKGLLESPITVAAGASFIVTVDWVEA